jgi:Arc/MetJ-type ribon-helix-helix transcriptional regulator
MTITLRPETLNRISEKIRRRDFENAEALVERAVTFFLDFEEEGMDEEEFQETRAAIDEALGQTDRGEGVSLQAFDQNMRAKYGIRR